MQKFCYKSVQPSALEHLKTTFISLFYFKQISQRPLESILLILIIFGMWSI